MADDASKPNSVPNSAIPNDPQKTQYNPQKPWSNIYNILTNRMTPVGKFHYREDAYIKNEARDCANCEEWRDWLFNYSPMIIFLQKNIKDLNGDLNSVNVRCRRCPARLEEAGEDGEGNEGWKKQGNGGKGEEDERWESCMKGYGKDGEEKPIKVYRQGGGFSPDHGILICANEMRNKKHLEDTLAHEMVHAWDHLRWKVDWADLRHAACTEIRASSLSGECRWTREFFTRNNFTITQQHQNCVRARAVRSVMARPSCKDDVQAVKVVNEVWDSCFADTRPFDEIYR